MAKITLVSATNSFILNGIEYQKGTLSVNHSTNGVSIGGVYADLPDITINGDQAGTISDLKTWVSANCFKSGGGSESGGAVNSVTGNLVTGTSENPVISLTGTSKDILTFDDNGNPDVKPIGITQLTDISSFPPFTNVVFAATAMNDTSKTGLLSFIEFSTDTPKAGTFPTYKTGGTLSVGNATQPADAINLGQINGFLEPINQSIAKKGLANGYAPLDASGLVPLEYLNVSGLNFKGAWNANTNTPNLINGTGSVGDFYKTGTPGTQNFGNGDFTFVEGDWVIFAAGVWQRLGSTELVASVNGKIGMVVINKSDVGLPNVDDVSAANLRDRSTHTGSQGLSTITDLVTIINAINTANDNQTTAISSLQSGKQNTLVSATTIKTLNGVSLLGSGNIVDLNQIISTSTTSNVKKNEYLNRFEYTCLIPFTVTAPAGVGRYVTQNTTRILPSGITIDTCDEHYISVRNNERGLTVAVWDNPTTRVISIGFGNTWSESVTATGSVFIKLVKYK